MNPNWLTRNSFGSPFVWVRGLGYLLRPQNAVMPLETSSYTSDTRHFVCPELIGRPGSNFNKGPDFMYHTRVNVGYLYWGDPWNTVTPNDMDYVSRMKSGGMTIWTNTGFAWGPEHLERPKYGSDQIVLNFDFFQLNGGSDDIAHETGQGLPAGGNVLMIDGHVVWTMPELWGTGGGANNWYVPRYAVP
jgi:prepilin-type processing-associated H-X9-DG protein